MRIQRLGGNSAGTFDPIEYHQAWREQRRAHAEVVAGASDIAYLLEHEAVYTAGRRTQPHERPVDGTPVIEVDRGGKITWHGPGQLTGYPIRRLPHPLDVVAYVRQLEELMIRTCAHFEVEATRVAGASGAWIVPGTGSADRKIGAIGIRVSQGVALHGFALNCDCDLSWANTIVPCGLPDAAVTSLSIEAGRVVTVEDVIPVVSAELLAAFGGTAS